MLRWTSEYKQTFDKFLELLADCTTNRMSPRCRKRRSCSAIALNSQWTSGASTPQTFVDHLATGTALFETTLVGNLMHNVNWIANFCCIGS